ncbi:MAG TPA: TonB-dependent receptor [Segetibacter sp.]|jgi:vitamin B12 transporter
MSKKIILSLLLAPLLINAQDSTKVTNLGEVTVTATRTEQSVINTPRSVTVITAADIQKQPYQNLADLLQRYEGIFIPGTFQTPGSLQTLYMRGADNKQTLVMIDGIRLSDASTPDNGLDFNEVSLNSIERIEIVRGSQGTLYGGSAVGGVVNIITKKNAKEGVTGSANITAGTFGKGTSILNSQAGVTYTAANGFYGRAEILNSTNKGFNSSVPVGNNFFINEKDDFNKTDYALKLGYSKTGWDAYAGYRQVDQKADIDDGAYKDDENNVLGFKRNLFTYGVTRKINHQFNAKFFGGYTNTERSSYDDSSITSFAPLTYDRSINDARYTGRNFTNEAQINLNKNNWKLVGGLGYVQDKMSTQTSFTSYAFNFSSTSNYDTLGIKMGTGFGYVHADYTIPLKSDQFINFAAGVRYSNNSKFGSFTSYEIKPSIKVGKDALIFASYSTGFNAPSLYQLFAPEKNFTSGISRGFEGLQPEESRSIEIGTKLIAEEVVGFRLSVYGNRVKNYIDYVYLWNGTRTINNLNFGDYRGDTYLNTGKQTNSGFETGIDIKFSEQLQLHTNLSYNHGTLEYSPEFLDAAKTKGNHVQLYSTGAFLIGATETPDLIRRPENITNTSIVYTPSAAWQFTADVRTVSSRSDVFYNPVLGPFGALGRNTTEGFGLFNLSALWKISKQTTLQANCFNIFDKEYVELNGFATRGRSFFTTLRVNF